jgi:hypothetical protein
VLTGREIGAVIVPIEGPESAMIVLAADMDDDLRANVLAFALAMVALIGDGVLDPALYADPEGQHITIGREYQPLPAVGLGHLAVTMAEAVGRVGPPPVFEVLPVTPPPAC